MVATHCDVDAFTHETLSLAAQTGFWWLVELEKGGFDPNSAAPRQPPDTPPGCGYGIERQVSWLVMTGLTRGLHTLPGGYFPVRYCESFITYSCGGSRGIQPRSLFIFAEPCDGREHTPLQPNEPQ